MGNPNLSVRHDCLVPWPLAAIDKGLIPLILRIGVDLPTKAASSQCVFSSFCWLRLNLVKPLEPVSTGSHVVFKTSNNANLVVFTAKAKSSFFFKLKIVRRSRDRYCTIVKKHLQQKHRFDLRHPCPA
ncbi:MAG: hypothetical protein ACRC62_10920 [Microcoleus sp.]